MNYKRKIICMILQMENENCFCKIYHYILAKYSREKGGAV